MYLVFEFNKNFGAIYIYIYISYQKKNPKFSNGIVHKKMTCNYINVKYVN